MKFVKDFDYAIIGPLRSCVNQVQKVELEAICLTSGNESRTIAWPFLHILWNLQSRNLSIKTSSVQSTLSTWPGFMQRPKRFYQAQCQHMVKI